MKIFGLSMLCFALLSLEWCARVDARGESLKFQALNLFPESFDWDPVHDRILLSSFANGTVSELANDGSVMEFVRDEELAGKVAFGGLIVDSGRNRVLVAVQDVWGNFSGVAAYDLDTRKRLYLAQLNNVGVAEGERSCANDVAVDFRTGDAYVTNCVGSFLWKVTKEGTPSVFVKHESFTSQPSLFDEAPWCSFNGIVHDQKKYLLAVQTNSGALFRVDVDDQSVLLVTLERLPGADGLVLRPDGALVVVSSRKVWLVRSNNNWLAANVVDTIPLDPSLHATTAALKRGSTFIVHAHLPELFANRTREEFELQQIEFPSEVPNKYHDPALLVVLIGLAVAIVSLCRLKMGHFYAQYQRKRA